jgi:phage tail-like protein
MAGGLPSLPSDALANYTFAIEIGGVEIAQFQEVSGIVSELDVIELKENTMEGKLVIHKAPGAVKPPTITLKRAKNSSTALWDWHEAMLLGNVAGGRKEGSIVLKGYDGSEVARYNFKGAWISKLEVGTLKAGANEVLPETATIVTEGLEAV